MGPKCKHNEPTPSIRALYFSHDDLSDLDNTADITQTNIILRATHDTRGWPCTQTAHTTLESPPNLSVIYGALDDENSSQYSATYGGEDFVAPLEDEVTPNIVEHQIPEDEMERNTVSQYNNCNQHH